MNTEDRRLIAECLTGRSAAFGNLVRRYQDRLFNAVFRVVENADDAADVVQDAFINAYQSLNSFKGTRVFTWLYRIAFNAAISLRRSARSFFAWTEMTGKGPSRRLVRLVARVALERAEEDAQLVAALNRLSPEHRAVLVLKDLEDQKYEEIARSWTSRSGRSGVGSTAPIGTAGSVRTVGPGRSD